MTHLQQLARAVYARALRQVDVRACVRRQLRCDGDKLILGDAAVPRAGLDDVLIVAAGKAALPMYEAAAGFFAGCTTLPVRAAVVSPQVGHGTPAGAGLQLLHGAHPTPDAHSLRAADAVLSLLAEATPRTAVLFLISGGASAMIERPLDAAVPFGDLAAFHQALVGSGLPIAAMNALRSHLSAVKGGRLAEAAASAALQCSLLVSDVPAAGPHVIGSGPSLPDPSTGAECVALLRGLSAVPASIRAFFAARDLPETPKAGHRAFDRAAWRVVLSSEHLAEAAAATAMELGFAPAEIFVDNACDELDYRDAARVLLARSAELAERHPRSCLISVGEVGVTLPADPGEGGRNQQFALFCASELARSGRSATVLSAGSDGIDGRSTAAGAVCDEHTVAQAASLGLSVAAALAAFDTAPLLSALGAAIVTGPTGNNLRDLRLVLTERPEAGAPPGAEGQNG